MKIGKWYQKRGLKFIWHRGKNLLTRYGLTESKAINRIKHCMDALASMQCSPTFLVPAMVVARHPSFIKHLEELGAEIGVHGYNHVDLKTYTPEQASQQLLRAVQVFNRYGLEVHGFRCPYLSCTDELLSAIPRGTFEYSSNQAIKWDMSVSNQIASELMVETINRFYTPQNAQSNVCIPRMKNGFVEIPVCVPDDLQLFDGYGMSPQLVGDFWIDLFENIHQRGELFTLMFHPELFSMCIAPILELLQSANRCQPGVWITRLTEIADWWIEKANFTVNISPDREFLNFEFNCSPRATILMRDIEFVEIEQNSTLETWEGRYERIKAQSFVVSAIPRPLIGVSQAIPSSVILFLQEQGYIIDAKASSNQCSVYLDTDILEKTNNQRELIDWIERTPGPLVRFWRWPNGYKSVFNISGDLDGLSLSDYLFRLYSR